MLKLFERAPKPVPIADTAHVGDDADLNKRHAELATKLGVLVKAPATDVALVSVLQEEGIRIYDLKKVEAYMDRLTRKSKTSWTWFPLRQHDVKSIRPVDLNFPGRGRYGWELRAGTFSMAVYKEAVPYPVLLTVEKLVERLGEDVNFFVAALNRDLDPFLGVRHKDAPDVMFVIERWDEPSFRG